MKSVSAKILSDQRTTADTVRADRRKAVFGRLKLSLFILIIYFILNLLHIGCPIKALSGISCPGCGMTRAMLAVLRFDLKAAFYYHPLFFLAPFMFLLFLSEDFIKPKYYKAAWIIILLLFIIIYLFRLIFTENGVVTIDMSAGLVLKLIHYII